MGVRSTGCPASAARNRGLWDIVDAVVMVPVLHTDGQPSKLVMIREFRIPLNGYSLAFPAGLLEEGGRRREDALRRKRAARR